MVVVTLFVCKQMVMQTDVSIIFHFFQDFLLDKTIGSSKSQQIKNGKNVDTLTKG